MAHFNLAVLEDQKDTDISPDAQKPTTATQDAEPSASAPDEQTYVMIPSRYAENSASRRPHPTGAVASYLQKRIWTCQQNTSRLRV